MLYVSRLISAAARQSSTRPKGAISRLRKKASAATAAAASKSPARASEARPRPTAEREGGGAPSSVAGRPSAQSSAAVKACRDPGKLRFDGSKAGLQKVDQAHVERVIQEASKGSAFYLKEQRREEIRRRKIEGILAKAAAYNALGEEAKRDIKAKVDCLEAELEAGRDIRRRYIHVDMDMFYAAVEEKKNPNLREVPFGVGSNQMLSTTNYIARQYGVRSGMPGFIGKKLCPDLLIVPNDFTSYRREAAIAHSIATRYDAHFVSLGLDELTMDVTDYLKEFPDLTASQIASDFRDEVFAKTQLTCSAGIAPTSALAKIASNVDKPNGQHEISLHSRADILDYVKGITLRKIPGIGYSQELTLNALDIKNCGDLLANKYLLFYLFKEKTFMYYLTIGLGLMEAHSHRQHEVRQSIGKEESFSEPLASPEAFVKLFRKLLNLCHAQCVREHLRAQQMRLVLKYRTYDNEQFSVALPHPTNDLKIWIESAHTLLQPHLAQYDEYRLVGVRMQKLSPEGGAASPHQETEGGAGDDVSEANVTTVVENAVMQPKTTRARSAAAASAIKMQAKKVTSNKKATNKV